MKFVRSSGRTQCGADSIADQRQIADAASIYPHRKRLAAIQIFSCTKLTAAARYEFRRMNYGLQAKPRLTKAGQTHLLKTRDDLVNHLQRRAASCALAGINILAISAHAQTSVSGAPQNVGADAASSPILEEVTVTAQKRRENLEDVPIAVTVLSGPQLVASGIQSTADLGLLTPGLNYTWATGDAAPFIRGVGNNNVGPGAESPVATYVDGVYYGSVASTVFSLSSVEQIEVLKGPQGTLFGRNATGGVISVNTLDPVQKFSGNASLGYGDYQTMEGSFYVTGGITDTIAANLSAYYQDQKQGYGRNLFNGEPVNRTETYSFRSKIKWDPSGDTSVTLGLDYSHEDTTQGTSWRPAPGATTILGTQFTGGIQDTDSPIQPVVIENQEGVSLKVAHDFGTMRLLSISAYRLEDFYQIIDASYGLPVEVLRLQGNTFTRQASQEVQLLAPTDSSIQWVLGLYGYYQFSGYDQYNITGIGIAPLTSLTGRPEQSARSGAVFGQATKEIAQDTNLTIGLRYTVEKRSAWNTESAAIGSESLGVLESASADKTFKSPTWRIALDHKFTPSTMGYVSYNRGFKSGQFNISGFPLVAVQPEINDAYEIGTKSTFFGDRLRFNSAVFYSKYKDLQVPTYNAGTATLRNAAVAKIYGVDLDSQFAVTNDLRLGGGLELLHPHYDSFPDAEISVPQPGGGNLLVQGNATGNIVMLSPQAMVFVTADWRLPIDRLKLDANVTFTYNDGWYADPDNRLRQPPFNLLNTKLTWTPGDSPFQVAVWGRNLTNKIYAQWLSGTPTTTDVFTPSPPRTFGITFSTKF
jgi:iron complex outermembrane recepter protein